MYLLTSSLKESSIYMKTLGTFSAATEAFLGVPQLYRCYIKKSAEGLNITLISLWAVGDFAKMLYNASNKVPIQLVVGAGFQLLVDILILILMGLYQNGKTSRTRE